MNRVLNLQTLATEPAIPGMETRSASSCSWALCGVCSSTSDSGCSGSEDEINAI
ncbi:hypothetical protein [Idiomarina abyssalis]|uniref:hypothetical protein n=1 Tax=Idiomarina abyssalis TaxID=86102 RepID=UPI003A8CC380